MEARLSGRSVVLMAAGIATALLVGFFAVYSSGEPSAPPLKAAETRQKPSEDILSPSLDCSFTAFMHNSTAIIFYFDAAISKGEPPRFLQRAFVSAEGTRTAFEGNDRPIWTYGLDEDGEATITSPDGATRIVLYGLKLDSRGVLPVEAGIRSNEFRNLGGQCRQTNLGVTAAP